jgi:hypothetical protein
MWICQKIININFWPPLLFSFKTFLSYFIKFWITFNQNSTKYNQKIKNFTENYQALNAGVANPNWSLGRNLKILPNYRVFGPHDSKNLKKYTQNVEKSLILDSSLGRIKFFLGRRLATPVLMVNFPEIRSFSWFGLPVTDLITKC